MQKVEQEYWMNERISDDSETGCRMSYNFDSKIITMAHWNREYLMYTPENRGRGWKSNFFNITDLAEHSQRFIALLIRYEGERERDYEI